METNSNNDTPKSKNKMFISDNPIIETIEIRIVINMNNKNLLLLLSIHKLNCINFFISKYMNIIL